MSLPIVYKNQQYESKAAVVRAMYHNGDIDDSPEQKKRVATLLGMTVQTVHATLVRMKGSVKPDVPNLVRRMMGPVVDKTSKVETKILNKFDECYEIAAKHGYRLSKIPVLFNLKGTKAGIFSRRPYLFRVNRELAKHNMSYYLTNTVPHEFSHYIVRATENCYSKPHGWEWKSAMQNVFGLAPRRCHDYDLSQVRQNRLTYKYTCGCRTFNIGAIRHRRILQGKKYFCKQCRQIIYLIGT